MNVVIKKAIEDAEKSIAGWGPTHAFSQPVIAAILNAKAIGALVDELAALRKAVAVNPVNTP
jgi:hypothetical protein